MHLMRVLMPSSTTWKTKFHCCKIYKYSLLILEHDGTLPFAPLFIGEEKNLTPRDFSMKKNHPPLWPLAAIVKGQGCHLFSAMSPCLRRNFALLEVCHLNHWWNTCCPRCREADWYHYLWFLSRFADSHKSQGNCYEKTSENHGEVPSNLVQEQKKMFGIILKARKSISKVTLLGVQWPCSCYGKAFPRWAPLSYK